MLDGKDGWTPEAHRTLDRIVQRSQRATGARLPSAFARGTGGRRPVLAGLISGGRGGEVRLKLYLSAVLLAGSKHQHEKHGRNTIVDVSSANWARALGLPDPESKGGRRVADAQNQLVERQLVAVERRAGLSPKITLQHPSGTGEPWVEPGTPYLKVPLDLWTNRWLWLLSAKEIAVLLAIIDLCHGKGFDGSGGPQSVSGTSLGYYGMSQNTWREATSGLESYRLITTDTDVVGKGLDSRRRRKLYTYNEVELHQQAPGTALAG